MRQKPSPPEPSGTPRNSLSRDQWLGWIGFFGIIVLAFLMSFHTLTDADIFWHLKTGEIIWQTHRIPRQDLYSFTRAGEEWIDAQWFFQAVIFGLYRISGYSGLIFFSAILSALTWALLLKLGFKPEKYFLVLLLCLISLQTASVRIKLRPEQLSFLYLALELFLIVQYQRGKRFALYFLPALALLWVNSEGLWPIYFVVLAVFLLEELVLFLKPQLSRIIPSTSQFSAKQSVRQICLILLISLPLILLNPYGIRGALFPLKLFSEISSSENVLKRTILEFLSPFSHQFPLFIQFPFILLLVFSSLLILYSLLRKRVDLSAFLLWGIFLYLALTAARNIALFAIICAGLVGKTIAESTEGATIFLKPVRERLSKFRPLGAGGLLLLMILLTGDIVTSRFFIQNQSYSRFGIGALETDYPVRATKQLKTFFADANKSSPLKIFSDMRNSGYLIWQGYPEWKIYIDPRLEVYGEDGLIDYMKVLASWEGFKDADQKYDFDVVILTPDSSLKELVVKLGREPSWVLIYLDGLNVVFVKNRPGLESALQKYQLNLKSGLFTPLPQGLNGIWMARERRARGVMLLWLGYPELALSEFKEGLKFAPSDLFLNFFTGLTLNTLQRYSEAIPYLEKVARVSPEDIPNQNELAWAYFALGQTETAVQIYRQVLKKYPKEITTCMNLALVYESIGNNLARQQWQSCWQIYQSDPKAYQIFYPELSRAMSRLQSIEP